LSRRTEVLWTLVIIGLVLTIVFTIIDKSTP
jgi:hypothetical protein